jgi:UDP-glucose 4-epimerase
MRKYGTKKIIYPSSAAVYGNPVSLPITEDHRIEPISPYGLSKWLAEHYLTLYQRMYGIDYTIFRYANIYGPRQIPEGEGGVISIFTDQIKNRETPKINGDGRHTRDFIYVGDVAQANLEAMNKGNQMVLNISTGEAVSVLELLQCMEEATGQSIEAIHREERAGDIVHSCLQPTLAHETLGWKATTSLLDGLKQTIGPAK